MILINMEDCYDRPEEFVKMYGLKKLQMIRKEPKAVYIQKAVSEVIYDLEYDNVTVTVVKPRVREVIMDRYFEPRLPDHFNVARGDRESLVWEAFPCSCNRVRAHYDDLMANSDFLKKFKPAYEVNEMNSDGTLTFVKDVFGNTPLPFTSLHTHSTECEGKLISLRKQSVGKNGTIAGRDFIKLKSNSDVLKALHLSETKKKQDDYLKKIVNWASKLTKKRALPITKVRPDKRQKLRLGDEDLAVSLTFVVGGLLSSK